MSWKFWRRKIGPPRLRHYLYFPESGKAHEIGARLQSEGFEVEVSHSAYGDNWLVLALSEMPDAEEEMLRQRKALTAIAEDAGGEYDGWEVGPLEENPDGAVRGRVGVWLANEVETRSGPEDLDRDGDS